MDIVGLAKMFEECAPQEDDEVVEEPVHYTQKIEPVEKTSFWDDEEITPVGFYKDASDNRPEPPYELLYRQNVGTGDVYLGLSMVDPSITCCDAVIIKVTLDIEDPEEIDLNVQNGYLDLKTQKNRLTLKLGYQTKDSETLAKWNGDDKLLTIEVPLVPAEMKFA